MELDLSHILTLALEALAGGLLSVGIFAVRRAADWLRLEADSEVRAYLQEAIERVLPE
jgi:hypothetical protein